LLTQQSPVSEQGIKYSLFCSWQVSFSITFILDRPVHLTGNKHGNWRNVVADLICVLSTLFCNYLTKKIAPYFLNSQESASKPYGPMLSHFQYYFIQERWISS